MATLEAVAVVLNRIDAKVEKIDEKVDRVEVEIARIKDRVGTLGGSVDESRANCAERSGKISTRVKLLEDQSTADKAYRNGKRAAETSIPVPLAMKIVVIILGAILAGLGGQPLLRVLFGN